MTASPAPHPRKVFAGDYAPTETTAPAMPTADETLDRCWTGISATANDWQLTTPNEDVQLTNGGVGRRRSGEIYYYPDRSRVDRSLRPRRLLLGAVRYGLLRVEVVAWHGAAPGTSQPWVFVNVAFHDEFDFYLPTAELLTTSAVLSAEGCVAQALGLPDPTQGLRRFTMVEGQWVYPEFRYSSIDDDQGRRGQR
jgi:hypothetical protein